MVVFVCGKTGKRVKYDGKDGLKFDMPTKMTANAMQFWTHYGPAIKMAALSIGLLLMAGTKVDLSVLVPGQCAHSPPCALA